MKKNSLFGASKIIAYTDGGSRGNPGPSAIGVVIESGGPSTLLGVNKEYGEYLGARTNNQAEYEAVIFALKKIKALAGTEKAKHIEVEIRMDSELVARQLSGAYKIKEPELKPLFVDVWNLRMDFGNVSFVHVPREENSRADRMVNKILDEKN